MAPGGARRSAAALLVVLLALPAVFATGLRPAAAQEPAPPRISLTPDCTFLPTDDVIPEMVLIVRGHNFPADAEIDVFSWEQDAPETRVTTNPFGIFEAQIRVFPPTDRGVFIVRATTSDGQSRAEAHFRVPCPGSVTVDPACASAPAPGTTLEINVTGSGWHGELAFVVTFNGIDGQIYESAGATVTDGAFAVTLRPPSPRFQLPLVDGLYAVIVHRQRPVDTVVVPAQTQEPLSITTFPIPCPEPEITLVPDCGPAGAPPDVYEIDVSGTGFVPLLGGFQPPITIGPPPRTGHVEILFDVEGQRQEFIFTGGVPPEGTFGPLRIRPFQRGAGPVIVQVRQLAGPHVVEGTTARAIFSVPCPPPGDPTVELEPDCGPPAFEGDEPRRYSIVVRGANFDGGPVSIAFDALGISEQGTELFMAEVTAPDGSFQVIIAPLTRPMGSYEVHVTQEVREPILFQLSFRVPCEPKEPTVVVRCRPETPQPGEQANLLIEAGGFFESAPLLLSITGSEPISLTTDETGSQRFELPETALPPGIVEVGAVQRDVRLVAVAEARAIIVLPCGTPPEPFLRVLPETTPPGFVVTVEGVFFPEGEALELRWTDGIAAGQPQFVEPDQIIDGSFRVQVLIFHRDFTGQREVLAFAVGGDEPLAESAALLVVPGRGSPPAAVAIDAFRFDPETLIVMRR